ncbi:DUF4390 domain-containing protein [Chromatium okenii]|jgi:hypothetical protein|uniref:DUF4390 domain-containing protein n=1 Tax=Chromatium okenii TaxID=61644 RepID=A0A2S7XUA1_9GAMM|nr:DUF4390 domain-containing protein [Chromatium okenii]MBV5311345.1 DUF4390 domain-containing protein [Chromatium okenii]PQJ97068.1 DUF4390 domain-containing protein [Chromatium okenii]
MKATARRWPLALSLLLTLLSSSLVFTPAWADEDFIIREPVIRVENGAYFLDTAIDAHFSNAALEALDHGVPLTIVAHVQVRRSSAWLWENVLLDQQLRTVIRYKPLSDGYEVYRLPGHHGRSFVTRDAALRALGEISNLQLLHQDKLDAKDDYEVQIKVFLDIEELPLPLRPMAYLKPSWQLSSGWHSWPLRR